MPLSRREQPAEACANTYQTAATVYHRASSERGEHHHDDEGNRLDNCERGNCSASFGAMRFHFTSSQPTRASIPTTPPPNATENNLQRLCAPAKLPTRICLTVMIAPIDIYRAMEAEDDMFNSRALVKLTLQPHIESQDNPRPPDHQTTEAPIQLRKRHTYTVSSWSACRFQRTGHNAVDGLDAPLR